MDTNILTVFEDNLNIDLIDIIISNSSNKELIHKIKIRPVEIKHELFYQVSYFMGKQIIHKNLKKEEIIHYLPIWIEFGISRKHIETGIGTKQVDIIEKNQKNLTVFRQIEIHTKDRQSFLLISKKGKATIKQKQNKSVSKEAVLDHNRTKKYILKEGTPVPFLIDLGVMTKEGKIVRSMYDKYKQINRFLEFVEDVLPSFGDRKELKIIDFGCGKSYLTFAIYYYLTVLKDYRISMIGLDLKDDVIAVCNRLSVKYQYDNLKFKHGDIASYEDTAEADMVVTLHACDTATDYALYKAMKWNTGVILSVPCCQHEINKQIQSPVLEPILKYGLIKERTSALITDGIRANIMEIYGYKTQILEFIDMEHTPKNILIRAVREKKNNTTGLKTDKEKLHTLKNFMDQMGICHTLYQLISQNEELADDN